jgi:protein-arginine kinase activator protein McsA
MKAIMPILLFVATIECLTRKNKKESKEFTLEDELNSMNKNQLHDALNKVVLEERYELACLIRDFINKKYG